MGGEACPHKLASTNHLRLLLYILIPTVSLLLLVLALTGIFGSSFLDSSPLPSREPIADSNGYHVNSTNPSLFETENVTISLRNHGDGDVTHGGSSTSAATVAAASAEVSVASSSQAPPTQPSTKLPDWLTSVTSLSTAWPIGTTAVSDTGQCQLIVEPQCHMLPYNQTWLSSSVAVVKSSEVDMLLRFFSYLSRLSCYRHIMLFGCSLALPECIAADGATNRRVVLPCASFCEAAREGCEPVLQMFNASWPDFLRCTQFSNASFALLSSSPSPTATASPAPPACYTPRQIKGKPSVCGGKDYFLCATGICVPQKLVCNGYNDCDDWSDETHCVCNVSREHRCGDGRCVSRDWLCDGDHDCLDKSDELNCSCKSQGLLECRNGQCIPSAFRCDGEDDCKDGSDEEHCSREQTQGMCVPGQPSCITTSCPSVCVGGSTACDPRHNNNNNNNCSRCEPISLELCMNLPYNLTSFPNYLGHLSQRESSVSWESSLFPALVQTGCYQYLMFYACTLLVPKCDPVSLQRVPPCRSLCRNAKEKCESVLGIVGLQWPEDSDCKCSPSHFKCRSGRCVLATKRCDGHLDCDDHSDEDNCGCSERALWECPGSKVCIKASMICDGFPDCPLLVDEANCSVCRDNELSCNNHQCVHRTLWCDGKKHCSDSSDEWNCVSLSDQAGSVLTVFRTAAEYQVCADEWNHELSKLTCDQLGLGVPSSVSMVPDQSGVPGRRRWLHVHPEWNLRNGSALQARLEKRRLRSASDSGRGPPQEEEDSGWAGVTAGGMAMAVLPAERSEWTRVRLRPHRQEMGSDRRTLLRGVRWRRSRRESADLWKVVLGLNNLDHPGVHSQSRGVRSIIVHPRYNRAVVDYDISVVQLESEVEETPFVRPVCLPQLGQLPSPDSYCYITGWGHMGNRMPFKLQEGEVRIISLSQCQSYFDMKTITPRMLCAGYDAGTVDSCMGDSGGPLVCEEDSSHWTLFGLTSWGSVCFSKLRAKYVNYHENIVTTFSHLGAEFLQAAS
ncbi:hypothetical protein PAMP_016089 [Pampus punctatissimus]